MDKQKLKPLQKISKIASVALVVLVFSACQKDKFNPDLSKDLEGKWLEKTSSDNILSFEKVTSFNENSSGIEFKSNGAFVNRSDKTWIGVPLPTYYSFDGIWQKLSESKYLIKATIQGVERSFQIEVTSLKDNNLETKFIFSNILKGIWVYQSENEGIVTYKLSNNFNNDLPGLEFKEDGSFKQRANSGWCGTPPISYTNYEGTWKENVENNYEIEVAYWGGSQHYIIELVSLIDNELKIKFIYPEN